MAPGIVKLFATVFALIGPAPADSPKEFQLQSGQKIVAIGDSITGEGSNRDTGFVRVIDAVLAKQYPDRNLPKVINAGMGGQRSEHLVPRFDKDVVQHKPAYVIIAIGINDVWQHLWDANRKPLPADEKYLTEYKKNVTTMVDAAQKAGIKVILVTPTFIGEDVTREANKRLLPYVEAERQIAAEKKCQLIDMHAIFFTALQRTGAAAALRAISRCRSAHQAPDGFEAGVATRQEDLVVDRRRRAHEPAGRCDHGGGHLAGPGRAGREDCGLVARDDDRQEMSPWGMGKRTRHEQPRR